MPVPSMEGPVRVGPDTWVLPTPFPIPGVGSLLRQRFRPRSLNRRG